MKKKLNYLVILLGALFLFSPMVLAKPIINSVVEQDEGAGTRDLYLVTANANGGTIQSYNVSQTPSLGGSYVSYKTSASTQYVTLPNGVYYIIVKNTNGETSDPFTVYVQNSCTAGENVTNATGTGTYERCYIRYYDGREKAATNAADATCAPGYNLDAAYSTISANDCSNKNPSKVGIEYRYCRKAYDYKCVKIQTVTPSSGGVQPNDAANSNAKLSSLSISTGTLTPAFSPSTYSYAATTDASSVTISGTLMNSSASFVNGNLPKTVNLNYGTNTITVQTKDGNTTNTYTIKIKRTDPRSATNTLSSLSISSGTLSPDFNSLTDSYTINVGSDVTSVDIKATLTDPTSSFVDGFGPRTVNIDYGYTRAPIKVRSQSGNVRVYQLLFGKDGQIVEEDLDRALLKSLELSSGKIEFDSKTFDYNVTVPYNVTGINVTATAKNESDEVVVNGGENLEADKINEISVVVTSSDGKYSNTYTIYVIRKNEDLGISNNSLLQDLSIEGYKIKFDAKNKNYKITAKEGVKSLVIYATPADNKATITINGNENLHNGSEVTVRVTAEDNSYTDYVISVKMGGQGASVFLTVIVVILIILAIAYLVLRAMGYKIYLNFGAVKDKITGIFRR